MLCSKCKNVVPDSDSYKHTKEWCKSCFNSYCIERWKNRRKTVIELMGGICIDCKKSFHADVYEIHHLRDKKYTWTKLKLTSWTKIKEEISKCVLLCANCHRSRHNNEGYYVKPFVSSRKITHLLKTCSSCGEEKDTSLFHKKPSRKSGLTSLCKECAHVSSKKMRHNRKEYALSLFDNKCHDCGFTGAGRCFDFHHLYGKSKDYESISRMSIAKIKEELVKCVLLCANCHRLRHVCVSKYDSVGADTRTRT
jgi:hypothetical protein